MKAYQFTGEIRTTYQGYNKLIEFYKYGKRFSDDEISLDFYSLTWIDANMSVVIQAIMNKLGHENNLKFSTDANYLKSKFKILFKNGFASNIERVDDVHKTTIKLEKFVFGEDDERYKTYIKEDLMSHWGLESLDKGVAESIRAHLFEIYCNIEHSESLEVFACGQYFPTKKRLHFTILDLGVGYLAPIKKKATEIKTSSHAIEWALEEGNTTRVDASGGGGLTDVLDYFENDEKGRFEIITGDAYWTSHSDFPIRKLKHQFCGTTINLIFILK